MMETSQSLDITMGFYHSTLHPSVCRAIKMGAHAVRDGSWRDPVGACFHQSEQLSSSKILVRDILTRSPLFHQGIFTVTLLRPF